MCFADDSTLIICSYLLQTNTSVKVLQLWDGFFAGKVNVKWMSMALQVRNMCCQRVNE